jgi:hypothetical protein
MGLTFALAQPLYCKMFHAIASTIFGTTKFWRHCRGIVCFVKIDFFSRLILFFYWLFYFGNYFICLCFLYTEKLKIKIKIRIGLFCCFGVCLSF